MKFKGYEAQAAADLRRAVGQELPEFLARLEADMKARFLEPGNLAVMENEMAQRVDQQIYRTMSEWMRRTAANAPEICPACDCALEQVSRELERELVLKTGGVKLRRTVGWCRRCEKWRCPADVALGASEITGHEQATGQKGTEK